MSHIAIRSNKQWLCWLLEASNPIVFNCFLLLPRFQESRSLVIKLATDPRMEA